MAGFVHYTAQTFGAVPSRAQTTQALVSDNDEDKNPRTLQWVHENIPSPEMAPARQELPVFSASSMIPFANNPNAASATSTGNAEAKGKAAGDVTDTADSIWDVPNSPSN
jgi:hypothetical protein